MSQVKQTRKISVLDLKCHKGQEKLVAVTAYDYTFARLVDGIADLVLVGDSLGMVVQGHGNTLPVTLNHMVYHSQAVARGLRQSHLCVDMPFLSYQTGIDEAVRNAGRLLQEGHAESVKLEGGVFVAPIVERLVRFGIPVLGHIGLVPQSVHALGGYKVQGRTESSQEALIQDALALEAAGAWGIVLEAIPSQLAKTLTEKLSIPTIGIGAGAGCNGQILVVNDLLGLDPTFRPKFVKRFAHLGETAQEALKQYAREVQEGVFPSEEHSFS